MYDFQQSDLLILLANQIPENQKISMGRTESGVLQVASEKEANSTPSLSRKRFFFDDDDDERLHAGMQEYIGEK